MFFDYHVHSNFSSDCKTDMIDTINKAIELNVSEICFTDHIDYDYPDVSIDFDIDLEKYFERLKHLSSKYKDNIKIKTGIEIGLQPHIIEKCNESISSFPFDFVICSIHTAEKKDLYNGDLFKGISQQQAYEKYYLDVLNIVKNFDNYSVVGHLDIIKRYGSFQSPLNDSIFEDILIEILKNIIDKGKGIEVNSSGFRYGLNSTSPTVDILKLYKKLGGTIITTGSDAHCVQHLCYKFDYVYELLKEIGFKYVSTFTKMKPNFIKIS
ncbi:histidinol-phosphatase (PHP family) [Alkalithermobacter thermoalcaliphilus JW-YL-7 = DSM 7308]|uniref:Histidinol-phosphatase n=1 Tax=Alkalithermobacter thermoalcaliphilus JW-YL-7 = DSM 7308 TaxID=1121328 RepID=A0A150FSP4_CLOPD|nr:histidinol phosphate phosphatase HisJ family [[Clostridium] paradoxum JW-YL-7 = DSM 7308]SHK43069.1 histidinol-phosphatase (PHP family) [[Clostridium] paradoxum JW-YL-7 = DSM 7308]